MNFNQKTHLDSIIIFCSSLLLFTLGLGQQEIIGFESRFYVFALEMWRHGVNWFPTTYQRFYPDYPVTSTLLIYLCAKLFGGLNKFTAVLPSALAASTTMVTTYCIGALHDRRIGWYSVGFLLLTLGFLLEVRTISLDMFVTAFTALSFYVVHANQLQQKKIPLRWLTVFFILSFSIRGPIGLVIPAAVVGVYYLIDGDWKKLITTLLLSAFLLMICIALLFGIAYHAGGKELLQAVLHMEAAGRMSGFSPPFYYYGFVCLSGYAITYLFALFIGLGAFWQRDKKFHFLKILTGWAFIILIGLSVPADKKLRYVLPMAPALALMCAYMWTHAETRYLVWLRRLCYYFCTVLPTIVLLLLTKLYHQHAALSYPALIVFFAALQVAILVFRRPNIVFWLAVFTWVAAYIFIVEDLTLKANRTQNFVMQIEELRTAKHAKLVFYQEGTDGLVIKYLANMPHEENPLFINDLKQLQMMHQPIVIITREENAATFSATTFHVIQHGKIGHTDVIVLSDTVIP